MNKKPTTYNEIIRMKKCYTLAKYFSDISEEELNAMYTFLGESPHNTIVANQEILSLVDDKGKVVKSFSVSPIDTSFDNITISNQDIVIIPHYDTLNSAADTGVSSINSINNNNNNNNS